MGSDSGHLKVVQPTDKDLEEDEFLVQCECWWTTGYYAERMERGEDCPVHTE